MGCENGFTEKIKRVDELLTPDILEAIDGAGLILVSANEAKDTCVTKAKEASTSASIASTKAKEASTSASIASTKAKEASTSASIASTKATEASTSASIASTKATEASTSASIASTKATEASTSASIASTKATEIEQYVIPEVAVGVATPTEDGLLSSEDKGKLDGIEGNANNYSHPIEEGSLHVPEKNETTAEKFLRGDGMWANLPTSTSIIYQAGDPTIATNPTEVDATVVNIATGELFNCVSNIVDDNKWIGQLGTIIQSYNVDIFDDGSCRAFFPLTEDAENVSSVNYPNLSDPATTSTLGLRIHPDTGGFRIAIGEDLAVSTVTFQITYISTDDVSMPIVFNNNSFIYYYLGDSYMRSQGTNDYENNNNATEPTSRALIAVELGDTFKWYQDGVLKAETTAFDLAEGMELFINNVGDTAVDGYVKNFRIFNRVLTAEELVTLKDEA